MLIKPLLIRSLQKCHIYISLFICNFILMLLLIYICERVYIKSLIFHNFEVNSFLQVLNTHTCSELKQSTQHASTYNLKHANNHKKTHTETQLHTQTHTHTYANAQERKNLCTQIQLQTQTHLHKQTNLNTQTYAHINIFA